MADALISVLLEKLASMAYEYVAEEVTLVLNVKKEVEECSRNLKAIRAVLEDAEQRQVKEASVRDWLDNLKEISFDMVDVLDDWKGEILRQQVEKQEREGTSVVVPKKKDCRRLETLPDFLSKIPLQNLTIQNCQKLTDRCTEVSGEEWPKISHIQKIIRLD
ncbi:unnamed protein product [Malus baccata var. baccata]